MPPESLTPIWMTTSSHSCTVEVSYHKKSHVIRTELNTTMGGGAGGSSCILRWEPSSQPSFYEVKEALNAPDLESLRPSQPF